MQLAFKGQALLKLSHILVTEEMNFFLSFILFFSPGMKLEWSFCIARASLVAQWVKSLPAVQDSHVQSLALEKEMTTHSSILAWRIPWTEEPGGLQSMGS